MNFCVPNSYSGLSKQHLKSVYCLNRLKVTQIDVFLFMAVLIRECCHYFTAYNIKINNFIAQFLRTLV